MPFLSPQPDPELFPFVRNDGGREEAGYKLKRDCVTRAITIATGRRYRAVFRDMEVECGKNPGTGLHHQDYSKHLFRDKWSYIKLDFNNARYSKKYLPDGITLLVRTNRHLSCVLDGVLNDTWNCAVTRTGRPKKIKGFFIKSNQIHLYHALLQTK